MLSNEILPHIEEIEAQNFDLVVEGMRKCGELGLLMIDAPEEYGGLELDKATSMLVGEKIGPAGSFSVAYAAHTGIGTLPLVYYGTKAQKEKYLEKIITGEWVAAYCLTEPESRQRRPRRQGHRHPLRRRQVLSPQRHQAVHHQRQPSPTSSPSSPRSTRSISPPSWSSAPSKG